MQVLECGDLVARCRGLNGEEDVNMMLIGNQPVGTWVLNFLGSAREVLSEDDALLINKAIEGLGAIMAGEQQIDVDHYFPNMEN